MERNGTDARRGRKEITAAPARFLPSPSYFILPRTVGLPGPDRVGPIVRPRRHPLVAGARAAAPPRSLPPQALGGPVRVTGSLAAGERREAAQNGCGNDGGNDRYHSKNPAFQSPAYRKVPSVRKAGYMRYPAPRESCCDPVRKEKEDASMP